MREVVEAFHHVQVLGLAIDTILRNDNFLLASGDGVAQYAVTAHHLLIAVCLAAEFEYVEPPMRCAAPRAGPGQAGSIITSSA